MCVGGDMETGLKHGREEGDFDDPDILLPVSEKAAHLLMPGKSHSSLVPSAQESELERYLCACACVRVCGCDVCAFMCDTRETESTCELHCGTVH